MVKEGQCSLSPEEVWAANVGWSAGLWGTSGKCLKTEWDGVLQSAWSAPKHFWHHLMSVVGSQHHQPSGSASLGSPLVWSTGSWLLSPSGGFQYWQNSSRIWLRILLIALREGTKGPWLYFMAKHYFLLTVFLYFCIFSLLWFNLLFETGDERLKFFFFTNKW